MEINIAQLNEEWRQMRARRQQEQARAPFLYTNERKYRFFERLGRAIGRSGRRAAVFETGNYLAFHAGRLHQCAKKAECELVYGWQIGSGEARPVASPAGLRVHVSSNSNTGRCRIEFYDLRNTSAAQRAAVANLNNIDFLIGASKHVKNRNYWSAKRVPVPVNQSSSERHDGHSQSIAGDQVGCAGERVAVLGSEGGQTSERDGQGSGRDGHAVCGIAKMTAAKYLTREQAADFLTEQGFIVAKSTLAKLATIGGGPAFRKFGKRVLYEPSELLRWVNERLR